MRVVVDQDEVLADFVGSVLDKWNYAHGTSHTREEINMWDMGKTLGKDFDTWFPVTISHPDFFTDLNPTAGAVEGFDYLCEHHDVVVATHVQEGVKHAFDGKRAWMKKHFPSFSLRNFICVSRKELIDGDALIDDGAHNIKAWVEARPLDHAFLLEAPWNRELLFGGTPVQHRVRNWAEITRIFKIWDEGAI